VKREVIAGIIRSGLKLTRVKHESGLILIHVSKEAGAVNTDNLEEK
jgi:hypothetical protein